MQADRTSEEVRSSKLRNFKTYLAWFTVPLIAGFVVHSKLDPGVAGVIGGLLLVGVFSGSRETQIGNFVAYVLGWTAVTAMTGWTRAGLGLMIMTICGLGVLVFWRRWAEIPDEVPETKPGSGA
jgi:hypothetical protein